MAHSIILILRIRRMDCQTKQFGWRVVDVVKAGWVVRKEKKLITVGQINKTLENFGLSAFIDIELRLKCE